MVDRISLKVLAALVLAGLFTQAQAGKSLGVATENDYICPTADTCADAYQEYFGDTTTADQVRGADEGFIIGQSGTTLIVYTNILDMDIWVLTGDEMAGGAVDPMLDGTAMTLMSTSGQIGDYGSDEYWGAQFSSVYQLDANGDIMYDANGDAIINDGWYALPEDPFKEGKGTFYAREITLTYSGYLTAGNYFFAVADNPCSAGISTTGKCKDYFSDRSHSAVAIPEPHLLALLGIGLLALAIVRRRMLSRKN